MASAGWEQGDAIVSRMQVNLGVKKASKQHTCWLPARSCAGLLGGGGALLGCPADPLGGGGGGGGGGAPRMLTMPCCGGGGGGGGGAGLLAFWPCDGGTCVPDVLTAGLSWAGGGGGGGGPPAVLGLGGCGAMGRLVLSAGD